MLMSQVAREASHEGVDVPSGGRLDEFEVLYRAQVRAMTAFFARRSRNPQVVADLTADTFVEAISSFLENGPSAGSERPWLYAIARRVYAKHCERSSRQAETLRDHVQWLPLEDDETEELAERIDTERSARGVLRTLAGLPRLEREAIELVDLAGLTPKEAAAALGVTAGALRVRLFRARARIRKESNNDV
jgi:RNA polymerase sigma factor (sigma-70 family)